jgi:hypothetical protein
MSASSNKPPVEFPSGGGSYYISDERLRAFRALTPEQKLRWQEEVSTFLRLAKANRVEQQEEAANKSQSA